MVPIELRKQVPCRVDQSELLGVATKHNFADVHLELLLLFGLLDRVKHYVVHGSLPAADDSFLAVFIHVHRLLVHHNLFLQLQVCLAENQDLPFASDVNIILRSDC